MQALKFTWPVEGMHGGYAYRIEAMMTEFLDQVVTMGTLCHEGPAEVALAFSTPMGKHVNAALVCSCGMPVASLEGVAGADTWSYRTLPRLVELAPSHTFFPRP
ncbi:hypothetical protein [Massilia sp. S19_KUP03_FR1]|uniref:hypothetical protein n=1 Tax=Massilia sp. S19_KUP03_FR1 TaxID=3025503 RepID=UPI002FCD8AB0